MLKRLLLLIAWLLLLFPPSATRADMAPPPVSGVGGLRPFEYQDTRVQINFERVDLNLQPVPPGDEPGYESPITVQVTAWFILRNRGKTTEQMQAVFPLDDFNTCLEYTDIPAPESNSQFYILPESFEVTVNGEPASVSPVQTDHPYQGRGYCDGYLMNWAEFDITIPVKQDVIVRVDYSMERWGDDSVLNVQYILETGAAWYGPIEQADLIFRFPYPPDSRQILGATTPGYTWRNNEMVWSYEDIEPTSQDNLIVSIISPKTWQEIQRLQAILEQDATQSSAWIELAKQYRLLAITGKTTVRLPEYHLLLEETYQQGMAANPQDAALHLAYANHLYEECCTYQEPETADVERILPYLDKALTLEPTNNEALHLLGMLAMVPGVTVTWPPTVTPAATLTSTATPQPTLTSTIIPPTATSTPPAANTATLAAPIPNNPSPTGVMGTTAIVIVLCLLLAAGWLIMRRKNA